MARQSSSTFDTIVRISQIQEANILSKSMSTEGSKTLVVTSFLLFIDIIHSYKKGWDMCTDSIIAQCKRLRSFTLRFNFQIHL